jgi:hypothetical protein
MISLVVSLAPRLQGCWSRLRRKSCAASTEQTDRLTGIKLRPPIYLLNQISSSSSSPWFKSIAFRTLISPSFYHHSLFQLELNQPSQCTSLYPLPGTPINTFYRASLLTTLGLQHLPPNSPQPPSYAASAIITNFLFAHALLSARAPKFRLGLDHNVSPREDVAKYGEKMVQAGKITREQLKRLIRYVYMGDRRHGRPQRG